MILPTTTRRLTARPGRPAAAGRPATRRGGASTDDGRRTTDDGRRTRSGFTLVELLVVILVLAILIALLLPAINAALRTARNAAVSAEINQLATALAQFKSKYGDYPPSRVYLAENGDYSVVTAGSGSPSISTIDPTSPGGGTTSRSASSPPGPCRPSGSSGPGCSSAPSGAVFPAGSHIWYDFNGNGTDGRPLRPPRPRVPGLLPGRRAPVRHGDEHVRHDAASATTRPIRSATYRSDPNYQGQANPMYNANRQPPFFEFNAGRLFLDPEHDNMQRGVSGLLRLAQQRSAGDVHRLGARELLRLLQRLRQRQLRSERRQYL